MDPRWAEAELSHLQDIPVKIIHKGYLKNQGDVEIECVVYQAGDTHYVTAGEVKEKILNEKMHPVPSEMRSDPKSCRLILCYEDEITDIPDTDRIIIYGKKLAQDSSSLAIADAETNKVKSTEILLSG